MSELIKNFPEFLFMGSILGFYIFTAIFLFILFVSEVSENGWLALISFVVFSLALRIWGNFNIDEILTLKLITYYLVIGLVHSVIRTYFYGRKRGVKRKEVVSRYIETDYHISDFDNQTINILKGNVFRWWFLFPISFLTWVFSDLLKDLWNQIYGLTKKSYIYVLNLGLKSIK